MPGATPHSAPLSATALPPAQARDIAAFFLPLHRWGNRSTYYYVRAKLGSDPLYDGVMQMLPEQALPVLDLGCGLGLMAHVLGLHRRTQAYVGVDVDTGKIDKARLAARRAGLDAARFASLDLHGGLPAHAGHVLLLDVLQYLDAPAQSALLRAAAERVAAGGRLILRTPLETGDGRQRTTWVTDRVGWLSGWMRTRPRYYPVPAVLEEVLRDAGLRCSAPRPLHGRTPFNSWLVVAER